MTFLRDWNPDIKYNVLIYSLFLRDWKDSGYNNNAIA